MVVEDVEAAVSRSRTTHRHGAAGVVRRAGDVVAGLGGHLSPNWVEASTTLHRPERAVVQVHRHLYRPPRCGGPAHKSTEHACSKGHRGVPIPDRCRPVDGLEVIGLRQRGEEAAKSTIGRGVESLAIAQDRIPIAAHLRPDEVGWRACTAS